VSNGLLHALVLNRNADRTLSAQNKLENEAHPYVWFPTNCGRFESGDGRLKVAEAAITIFVSSS
jgi:hypothetical protein